MNQLEERFAVSPYLLLEGALGERLKREYGIAMHPDVVMGALVRTESGRQALRELWTGYAETAACFELPFLATTPTRRTNRERTRSVSRGNELIGENVAFLRDVQASALGEMYAGVLTGSRGEAYTGQGCLPYEQARDFHLWEAERIAKAGPDFIMAGLMPTLPEAAGMAAALSETGLPYLISFTLQRNGCLPDGTPLSTAVSDIDSRISRPPLCYMTNCVHPSVVSAALLMPFNRTPAIKERFLGIQANTSALPYDKLDGSAELFTSTPEQLAAAMRSLLEQHPMKLLGGCCGTDRRHLEAIAALARK